MLKIGLKNEKYNLILKTLLILAILVFAGVYFVGSIQKAEEVSMCGFEIAKGELVVTIRNGTVAQSGDIRIGASIGADNSSNLSFFDGVTEKKFNVKECDMFEYKTGLDIFSIKVAKIYSNTNWWNRASGSSNASVELIILHTMVPE